MKKGLRILIADDHAAMRGLIRRLCAPHASEFAEACDGEEAVHQFESMQPELFITDIDMPVMDGLSAMRAILAEHPEARVIIVTQHDSPEYREEATRAGAFAFVNKDNLSQIPSLLSDASPLTKQSS